MFTLSQRAAWYDSGARYWWLDENDRDLFAAFCRMRVEIEDPFRLADAASWNIYIRLACILGIAPTTRGKMLQDRNLGAKADEDDNDI